MNEKMLHWMDARGRAKKPTHRISGDLIFFASEVGNFLATIREQAGWIHTKINRRFVIENVDGTETECVSVDIWCDPPAGSIEIFALAGFENAVEIILRDLGGGGAATSLENVRFGEIPPIVTVPLESADLSISD
jgi:hypothetical protein